MQFTTKLNLGQRVFILSDDTIRAHITEATVGQLRVTEVHPSHYRPCGWETDAIYKEEYMCVESGIGSGRIYTYGRDIFATHEEAERGRVARDQQLYFNRKEHEERQAKERARREAQERRQLEELKAKYEAAA
jgi:hypothetical protein